MIRTKSGYGSVELSLTREYGEILNYQMVDSQSERSPRMNSSE